MGKFQVVVGNVGIVYDGDNDEKAEEIFEEYIEISKSGASRAGDEPVTLMEDNDIVDEYMPPEPSESEGEDNPVSRRGKVLAEAGAIRLRRGRGGIWVELVPGILDEEDIEELRSKPMASALYELFEYIQANTSWELLRPEDIGALTSAPILGYDVTRDDMGDVQEVAEVYWFPNYAIEDEVEKILVEGAAFFDKA